MSESYEPPGPFLRAALFCQDATTGVDGLMTFHGVFDHLVVTVPPNQPFVVSQPLVIALSLQPGTKPVTGAISVEAILPDGQRAMLLPPQRPAGLGPNADLLLRTTVVFRQLGIHWFEVRYEGRFLTRIRMVVTQ